MRFAFGIVKLFPGGGLQRDCVEIARHLGRSGHEVTIFTSSFDDGDFAKGLDIKLLPNGLRTNHGKQRRFSDDFSAARHGRFDLSLGFDKLAGLDVLYCADPSTLWRVKQNWHLYLRIRYRTLVGLERHSFKRGSATRVLLQDAHQLEGYQKAWSTEAERITLLPPTIASNRQRPEFRRDGTRSRLRRELALTDADWIWMTIQVQPRTKGLDRTLHALRACPTAQLVIVGLRPTDKAARHYARLARRLGVESRVRWLGHREDVPELLSAADVLVHPARYDTTGSVILEAILNELPVIATQVCGYADHLARAKAGIVMQEPFDFAAFVAALHQLQDAGRQKVFAEQARAYSQHQQFNLGKAQAASMIVAFATDREGRNARSPAPCDSAREPV
jgi:UDP-glucose:(heptosyl)LPS alpha-1,3-glucosyltransferase